MDSKYIEQLLERYWQCETSLEDEAELRAFFSGSDVPKHLLRYKDLFVYQQLQQEVHLGEDFDARVLAEVEVPVVKAKRLTLAARFMPLFKAAAVVAVVLSLGNVMHWYMGTNYYIIELGIKPECQGRGLGTEFLRMIEEYIHANGISCIFLQTERDMPAYDFYRKNGFDLLDGHVSLTKFLK